MKAFVVPELNLGQMVREVERAAGGKAKTFAVSHAGGGVHNPDEILNTIVEASDGRLNNPPRSTSLTNPVEQFLRTTACHTSGARDAASAPP